jgi:DEAD/DEAH box helicase domain-containing protein
LRCNSQRQPDELFNKGMQSIAVDIDSPLILEGHLQCAANEQPIDLTRDCAYFGEAARSICKDHLVQGDEVGLHIAIAA